MFIPGESDESRDVNIAPPAYEENNSNLQDMQEERAMPIHTVYVPAQGARNCTTDVLPAQNVELPQRHTRNVDDVSDIDTFILWNILAFCCCCWPIGLLGLIFSLLSYHAKSKGYRDDALWFLLIARILCGCSVIVLGVVVVIVIAVRQ